MNHNLKSDKCVHLVEVESVSLQAQKWYQLFVRHTTISTKLKNIFSTFTNSSSKNEMSIFLNGKLIFSDEVRFPKIKPCYMRAQNHVHKQEDNYPVELQL